MKAFRRMIPKRAVSVIDAGSSVVRAVIADKRPDGRFDILARAEVPSNGFARGGIANLGDAVESVVAALADAGRQAGFAPEKIYYAFDDAQLINSHPRTWRVLKGEGEIRLPDIEDARRLAERFSDRFDRSIVYSRPVQFLIDDRDPVSDPLGVFGRKLDVWTHVMQARADHCQLWNKLIERAGLKRGVRVLTPIAVAYGILVPEVRNARHLIADAGADVATVFVWERGAVTDVRMADADGGAGAVAAAIRGLAEKYSGFQEVLLCGDRARHEDYLRLPEELTGIGVSVAVPFGISGLERSSDASSAGLVRVAEELENRARMIPKDTNVVESARGKLMEWIHEYF